jgi:flavodoxin
MKTWETKKGGVSMAKALIVYYSLSGNTKKMAESIAEGIIKEKIVVDVRDVKDITAADPEYFKRDVDSWNDRAGRLAGRPLWPCIHRSSR